ncbi:MAG: hypothetical protein R2867_19040 [Caldilineaceae bacterium]
MLTFMLIFALYVSACGNDEPEVVDVPAAGEGVAQTDADVTATDDGVDIVDTEAQSGESEVVATSVNTETISNTDVITQIQVLTETQSADIITETTVTTNTDVTVQTDTDTETSTDVQRESIDDSGTAGIVILTDSAGNDVLGDPLSGQPIFAGDQGFLVNDNFVPITADEEIVMGEGFDPNLFGEQDESGVRQLTFNNYYLYRYVGPTDEDWRPYAEEFGLTPLTPQGDAGEFSD